MGRMWAVREEECGVGVRKEGQGLDVGEDGGGRFRRLLLWTS